MPYKTWVVGEEVLAADFNTYVGKQTVSTFANAAARDAAIPAPTDGMLCYLLDVQSLQARRSGAWKGLPAGQLAYIEQTADSGGVTTTPTGTLLDVTVTVVGAGRRIKVSTFLMLSLITGAVASHVYAAIYQDGVQIVQGKYYLPGSVTHASACIERVVSPAAGSHRYQVYIWADAQTVRYTATTTNPASLTVEDLGT